MSQLDDLLGGLLGGKSSGIGGMLGGLAAATPARRRAGRCAGADDRRIARRRWPEQAPLRLPRERPKLASGLVGRDWPDEPVTAGQVSQVIGDDQIGRSAKSSASPRRSRRSDRGSSAAGRRHRSPDGQLPPEQDLDQAFDRLRSHPGSVSRATPRASLKRHSRALGDGDVLANEFVIYVVTRVATNHRLSNGSWNPPIRSTQDA